jgi:hypothetical protein
MGERVLVKKNSFRFGFFFFFFSSIKKTKLTWTKPRQQSRSQVVIGSTVVQILINSQVHKSFAI